MVDLPLHPPRTGATRTCGGRSVCRVEIPAGLAARPGLWPPGGMLLRSQCVAGHRLCGVGVARKPGRLAGCNAQSCHVAIVAFGRIAGQPGRTSPPSLLCRRGAFLRIVRHSGGSRARVAMDERGRLCLRRPFPAHPHHGSERRTHAQRGRGNIWRHPLYRLFGGRHCARAVGSRARPCSRLCLGFRLSGSGVPGSACLLRRAQAGAAERQPSD